MDQTEMDQTEGHKCGGSQVRGYNWGEVNEEVFFGNATATPNSSPILLKKTIICAIPHYL